MPNLNKVMLIGNLTRDPELRFSPKGTPITEFGLAINRTWKDDAGNKQEDTTFVDMTAFGKTAEIIGQYLRKGSSAYIDGRLQLDTWDDKQTGQKRSKLKVIVDAVQFLGGKADSGAQDASTSSPSAHSGRSANQNNCPPPPRAAQGARSPEFEGPSEDEDETLPF